MIRYGKSSDLYVRKYLAPYLSVEGNDRAARHTDRVRDLYLAQPGRTHCKMCGEFLHGRKFSLNGVPHVECGTCGHVNGGNEDTKEYCAQLYQKETAEHYNRHYSSADREQFLVRVEEVYREKVAFLFDALREKGETPEAFRYADIGAGTGYFVGGLLSHGAQRVAGYDASEAQIAMGNDFLGGGHLHYMDLDAVVDLVVGLEAEVVTMIFALEHVRPHRQVLAAVRDNPRIRFFYFSVPMFGISNFLEATFPGVFARHTGFGTHTHHYTRRSIEWMCEAFGFEPVAEWWFGSDAVDILRSVHVRLQLQGDGDEAAALWMETFGPIRDSFQEVLDCARLTSELHMVVRKRTAADPA